jgi:DNA-directed RNA polymerase subunit F
MIGKKTLETKPIPMVQVKEILVNFSENFEPSYEQNLTIDHVTKFSKLPLSETKELIDELKNETGLKGKYAVKLADIMPEDLMDIRLLFQKERIPMSKEDMEKILEIVDKYRDYEE